MEKFYTPEEVAEMLKISRKTIYNWLHSGKIKGSKISTLWRISEKELNRILGENKK